jgi:tRNA A37 threonylcarbamoyladenosine synthetase subunit TsaC/SUA5/YrdC
VKKDNPLDRRTLALENLLALDRSTTKAMPYAEWPSPPTLVYPNKIESNETKSNETFQFRVGKHLFEGKVTKVKKIS